MDIGMDSQQIRKGFTQAQVNEQAFGFIATEILLLSIVVGFEIGSWFAGIGVFIGLIFALVILKKLAFFLMIGLSIIWGYIGYIIGGLFGTEAMFALAILGFLVGVGIHLQSIQYMRDLG
jgi:hypothetical protein